MKGFRVRELGEKDKDEGDFAIERSQIVACPRWKKEIFWVGFRQGNHDKGKSGGGNTSSKENSPGLVECLIKRNRI